MADSDLCGENEGKDFLNAYKDRERAEAYAALELPGTYHLAYRDLPNIFRKHLTGKKALDFGCGAGRSTRFLKDYGFAAAGVDISEEMILQAKARDPGGRYDLIQDGNFTRFEENFYDLVLSVFTFDNIPGKEHRTELLRKLARLMGSNGRMILVDSTPEIYLHEWASFSTERFPENRFARSGQKVKTIITDSVDRRPVEDILWFNEDYLESFANAGLEPVELHYPLGKEKDGYEWVNEKEIAPWVIYVLQKLRSDPDNGVGIANSP